MNTKKESVIFQEFCKKIVGSLQQQGVEEFHGLSDDENRIRFLFKYGSVSISKKPSGKNLELAKKLKEIGNAFYSKKDLKNALKSYSKGILICPQDTASSKEVLAVLIANRSAVLFEMKKLPETLSDIEYALEGDGYPKHLLYKLYTRKAKCLTATNEKDMAISSLKKAEKFLQFASLKESAILERKKEISEALNAAQNLNVSKVIKTSPKSEFQFTRNKRYNGAHVSVDFSEDERQGRFAIAKADMTVGTVIIEEAPFCSVLTEEYSQRNCQNCAKSLMLPIACPKCTQAVFCSLSCKNAALDSYHKRECKILPDLFESKASVNCAMALRIITSQEVNYFENFRQLESLPASRRPEFDVYHHVYNLCRHETMRKPGDFLLYTAMALFLLKLLKRTDYFGNTSKEDSLSDSEAYVGSLILRFLQILQFNAHETSELQPESQEVQVINSSESCRYFKSVYIGGALYPTLALFNHSCEPSIVRYNIGNRIIVRLIKNVKEGDIIYENYGPIYTTEPKAERRKYLQDRYWFTCQCIPCEENWPLFDQMSASSFRIPCKTKTCKNYIVADNNMDPFKNCGKCGAVNTSTVLTSLKKLQDVDTYLNSAEEHFKKEEYDRALQYFLSAMKIYHACTLPPFPDYIKVQQRLRTCMVHMGNKLNNFSEE